MKTTIEIPDSLHKSIKLRAVERGTTLRDFIVDSLQAALRQSEPGVSPDSAAATHSTVDADGWPVLKRSAGVIPDSVLRELREQEGV